MAPAGAQQKTKGFTGTVVAQADDSKYKQKYKELKAKIYEIEQENAKTQLKILKSKKNIQRLRVERSILYDRLTASPIPSNPYALHSTHLSALASSSSLALESAPVDPTRPPTILDPTPYLLADPQAKEEWLEARKALAGLGAAGFGERPQSGISAEQGGRVSPPTSGLGQQQQGLYGLPPPPPTSASAVQGGSNGYALPGLPMDLDVGL